MKNKFYSYVVMMVTVLLMVACNLIGQSSLPIPTSTSRPQITISSPTAGTIVEPGREIKVQSTSVDPEGVERVELLVNGALTRVDTNANSDSGSLPFIVAQPWIPQKEGFYVIQVRSYDTTETMSESEPLTLEVAQSAALLTLPTPTYSPTPTTSPTSAEQNPVETPTPLHKFPTQTPTATPIILDLPTPTATPTVGNFQPTGHEPEGRFRDIWQIVGGGAGRLGYPIDSKIQTSDFAKQRFQYGELYWWNNPNGPDYMWAIDTYEATVQNGKTWNMYTPSWPENEVEVFNCIEATANGDKGPTNGFGKLWCERFELQVRLGNPVELIRGSAGNPPFGELLNFQGGTMLYDPIHKDLFVLFNQGDWQRYHFD